MDLPPAPRTAWHDTYQRLVFDTLTASHYTLEQQGRQATVTLPGLFPTTTLDLDVPGDHLHLSSRGHTLQVSGQASPLHVNVMTVQSGGKARLAIDVYPASTWLSYQPPSGVPCALGQGGTDVSYQAPTFASGEIGFYLAQIDPQTLSPIKVIQHNADALFPLASTFKSMTLWGALRDVDAGRLNLNQMFDVTLRNRSIESYQPGPRTLLNLLQQMIKRSENTAADIAQGAVGAERLQQLVTSQGSCNTSVRVSTKAWWAAQGGLLPDVFGTSLPTGAAAYFAAPDAEQAQTAAQAIQSAMNFTPSQVDDNLNRYFSSSTYSPQLDVQLQNHSTAREWAALTARLYLQNGLSDTSQTLLRTIMSSGCCTKPGPQYWGSKAGSGWRLLTMSGLIQVNGSSYVYSYLNHGSDIMDTDHLERQLPQVSSYILSSVQRLQTGP